MLDFSKLDAMIEQHMQDAQAPGVSLALVQDGRVAYAKGYGVTRTDEYGVPITPATTFRIGSVAKVLTATLVMRLVEKGVLELDRPIIEYLPDLRLSEEGAAEQITLRLLLSHAAGIANGFEREGSRDADGLERFVREQLPSVHLIFPPGKTGLYSNLGISLAGYVAEAVTGVRFPQLMQNYLFDPLGMTSTTYDPTEAMTQPMATSYRKLPDGGIDVWKKHTYVTYHHPEGGGYSTALDLAQFLLLHLNGGEVGGERLLKPESVAEMHALHADYYTAPGNGYGLSFELTTYKGLKLAWKDGMLDGYATWVHLIPEKNTGLVMFCSRGGGFFDKADDILHTILDQLFELPDKEDEPVEIEEDRSYWNMYHGKYIGPWTGLVQIDEIAGQLTFSQNGGERVHLKRHGDGRYFGRKLEGDLVYVGFLPEADGQTQYAMVDSIPCKRVAAECLISEAPAEELALYEGTYQRHDARLRFWLAEGEMRMGFEGVDEGAACQPLDQHRFWADGSVIEFILDLEGRVQSVNTDRTDTYNRTK